MSEAVENVEQTVFDGFEGISKETLNGNPQSLKHNVCLTR